MSSTYCWSCSDCIKSTSARCHDYNNKNINNNNNNNNNIEDDVNNESEYNDEIENAADLKYLDDLNPSHPLHHIIQILRYHKSYLRSFLKAYNFIIYNDGPLSMDLKLYIAIMSASRHQCSELITSLSEEFSESTYQSVDVWLLGLKMAPKKLQQLDTINRLLAHQPWLLTPKHIQELRECSSGSWSMTELTQAIVIMALFHSLCSLLNACGVGVEQQQLRKNSFSLRGVERPVVNVSHCRHGKGAACAGGGCRGNGGGAGAGHDGKKVKKVSIVENKEWQEGRGKGGGGGGGGGVDGAHAGNFHKSCLLSRTLSEQEASGIEALLERMKLVKEGDDVTPEENMERFNRVERQSAELVLSASKGRGALKSLQESNHLHYSNQADFTYMDFATYMTSGEETIQPFTTLDFNWGFHGFAVATLYYQGLGEVLDEKFEVAKKLTYNTIGTKSNVDTTSFRRAIWMYTQCMYGLMDESYDYNIINGLLEESLRTYIKMVTCFPENVTKEIYDSFMVGFLPSEKVHVNVMIQEARFEAELLYGLKAISHNMST